YGIIKQHNARIDVESEPGKGTTFRIYMPLDHTEMACEIQPESPPPAAGSETILVAEDDDVVRDIVKCTLEEFGYRVIEAIDGESAVRAFSERKNEIQLALFDVIMPKRNGKEAYEEIKTLNPALKVLFMSGYPGDIVNQKGLIEERDNFIEKPVGPNELLIKVREVLDGPGVLNS
ncbi:MAG TPA: response regulator, partial [Dissulfurispiraceae bacterium]